MKYTYTIIYVKSVKETVEFYEKAFGFQCKFITPEEDYGELVSGETKIAFASIELGKSNFKNGFQISSDLDKPFGVEMAFTSENVDEDFKKAIAAGAKEYEGLTQKPWGQKVGYVLDNNGFLIEICSVMEE